MSYVPSHQSSYPVAQPKALTVIEHTTSTNQTITVGNRVDIGTIRNWYGSFSPSISTNKITLPIGYYYYLETSVQTYAVNNPSNWYYTDFSFQHYNETSSANVGTLATNFGAYGYSQDLELFSRDACAKLLLDCTSGAIDISIKVVSNDGYDRMNYTGGNQPYSGYGRTVIWQLESAP